MSTGAAQRVLLVEDEELVSRTLARVLQRAGFDVTVAASVGTALELLEETRESKVFRHVVLDLRLPDGDGETVLDRCDELTERPAVVVLAAPEGVDCRRMASLNGRCDYLPKPVVFETLVDVLNKKRANTVEDYADAHRLSRREREVLAAAVGGLDLRETARKLGCKVGTVRTHWTRLIQRTHVKSRDQVLAHVIRWLAHVPLLEKPQAARHADEAPGARWASPATARGEDVLPENVLRFPVRD